MDTGDFTLEQCSLLYGIPSGTMAHYIELGSEFFIAEKKHKSMDLKCQALGIGQNKKDPRSNYYISPYHYLAEEGFVRIENI